MAGPSRNLDIKLGDRNQLVGTTFGDVTAPVTVNIERSRKDQSEKLKDTKTEEEEGRKIPFANEETIALVLTGVGKTEKQTADFLQSQENVKQLVTGHFDVKPENIMTVGCKSGATGNDTRKKLLLKFRDIKDLVKHKERTFLFYYLGHNSKQKKALWIDNQGTRDDYIKHEDLKEELRDLGSPCMVFIVDSCYSGEMDLDKEEDIEELFPLLWDEDLAEEDDVSVLQWSSSQPDEKSWFANHMGYFTAAIRDVLKDHSCGKPSCSKLRQQVSPGTLVSASQLHPCVCDHVTTQRPVLWYNKGDEKMCQFPAIAKLK